MLPESEDEAGVGFQECGKMPQWIHQDSVYPLLLSRDHASSCGLIPVQGFNYFQLHAVCTFSSSLSFYVAQAGLNSS